MKPRLVILGSKGGPAIRPGGPSPTSSLLQWDDRVVVVDCGLGVTRGIVDDGVSLKQLDLVFVTHLHSDHVLELGPLVHTAWTSGLDRAVTIHGPPGTAALWARFVESMQFDIETRIADEGRPDIRDMVAVSEFREGLVCSGPGLDVAALRVHHPPVEDCYALRFDFGAGGVVFSADTANFPPLADFARGAAVLVHEAMLLDGVDRLVARTGNGARLKEHLLASHSLAQEAGRIASLAEVKLLVLHHLIPADDPLVSEADWIQAVRENWSGPLIIGCDGCEIALGHSKGGREDTR